MTTPTNKRISDKLNEQWQLAVENTKRLHACPRHLIDFTGWKEGSNIKRVSCLRCTGKMELREAVTYIRGYVASGKPVSDVAVSFTVSDMWCGPCTCPHCDGKSHPDDFRGWNEVGCNVCHTAGVVDREVAVAYLDRARKANA